MASLDPVAGDVVAASVVIAETALIGVTVENASTEEIVQNGAAEASVVTEEVVVVVDLIVVARAEEANVETSAANENMTGTRATTRLVSSQPTNGKARALTTGALCRTTLRRKLTPRTHLKFWKEAAMKQHSKATGEYIDT